MIGSGVLSFVFVLSTAAVGAGTGAASAGVPVEWLSRSALGGPGGGAPLSHQVSDDGRYVAWQTKEGVVDNAGGGDWTHVYVRDRLTGEVERADVLPPDEPGRYRSWATLSSDGRFVAFTATTGSPDYVTNIYLRDLAADTTTLVTERLGGGRSSGASFAPQVSTGGRYVSFTTTADDLVPGLAPRRELVVRRDLQAGETWLVSQGTDGKQPDANVRLQSASADGRFLVWESRARNLTPGEVDTTTDVFLHDTATQTTTKVSRALGGGPSTRGSTAGDVADDGSTVVFSSRGGDLVPGDDNDGDFDVFAYDAASSSVSLVSKERDGTTTRGHSYGPSMSSDGSLVSYTAQVPAQHVDEAVPDLRYAVVVRELGADRGVLVARRVDGTAVTSSESVVTDDLVLFQTPVSLDPRDRGDYDTYGAVR